MLLANATGLTSVAPADGKVLWEHQWRGFPIVQPAFTAGRRRARSRSPATAASRRLAVAQANGGWTVEERWTSPGLKPYFNDFVVHKGHAVRLRRRASSRASTSRDGERKWKGGRYGNGQLVLLADQDLLLVLSEDGELALVNATPDRFTEVAQRPGAPGARPGTTRRSRAILSWFVTARRWSRSASYKELP